MSFSKPSLSLKIIPPGIIAFVKCPNCSINHRTKSPFPHPHPGHFPLHPIAKLKHNTHSDTPSLPLKSQPLRSQTLHLPPILLSHSLLILQHQSPASMATVLDTLSAPRAASALSLLTRSPIAPAVSFSLSSFSARISFPKFKGLKVGPTFTARSLGPLTVTSRRASSAGPVVCEVQDTAVEGQDSGLKIDIIVFFFFFLNSNKDF